MKPPQVFTLGVGPWNALAHHAARQFAAVNGCEVTVIEHVATFRRRHPSWCKLDIFELATSEEAVIFDADLCAIAPSLAEFVDLARSANVALLGAAEPANPAVELECALYDIPRERYFNCGLLYLRRAAAPALEWASLRHPQYGAWLEQTALNAAVIRTGLPYALAPARFNTLIPPRPTDPETIRATGALNAHFAGWKDPATILRAMKALE